MTALTDLIYEAAFVPEHWDEVLQQTADLSGSAAGTVFFIDSARTCLRGTTIKAMRPLFEAFMKVSAPSSFDSALQLAEIQPASFVHIDQALIPEDFEQQAGRVVLGEADDSTEYRWPAEQEAGRVLLRGAGIGAHLTTAIPTPTGDFAVLVYQKWAREGAYAQQAIDRMDALRPHLARSSLIASRMNAERARATVSALELLGLPAAVVQRKGKVLAANAGFEGLLNTLFVTRAFGGVAIINPAADGLLQTAFKEADQNDHAPLVASIPIAARADQPPHVVHLVPLRRSARDIFTGGELLLVVNQIDRRAGLPSNALVAALFDLSPAETRLALRLAAGVSLVQAGQDCGLSSASARTYLARVFSKTGTHSQHQLVALLRSAGPLG